MSGFINIKKKPLAPEKTQQMRKADSFWVVINADIRQKGGGEFLIEHFWKVIASGAGGHGKLLASPFEAMGKKCGRSRHLRTISE